jgi:glycosyltransferase involved in cell wall biosynthesis
LEQEWEQQKIGSRKLRVFDYLMAKLLASIKVYSMKKADLILTTTQWFQDEMVKKGIGALKYRPYPSGVDTAFFSKANGGHIREKYKLGDSKLTIYVGTLEKARCLHVLVQAFSKVRKRDRRSKLLIVGEGSDIENLVRLADELGIKDDIVFTGWIPESELLSCIAAADIGVSPVPPLFFYKVSSPTKTLEYMAMSKPVVASEEIADHKEVLEQSGGGILVPFTPEAFAKAIIDLLDHPEKAIEMGRRGKEWVIKNRSYQILAQQLEEWYYELVLAHMMNKTFSERKVVG